jgi:superfamily II DNA/RNA helicase
MDSGQEGIAVLHGDMRQSQRNKTITRLRQQKVRVLVATDVAARGIDVSTVTHVINFDLPMSVEDYVHRIGRTARAGASGVALSFVSRRDFPMIKRIEAYLSKKMEFHTIAGLEPKEKAPSPQRDPGKPFSDRDRQRRRRGGGKPSRFRSRKR